MPSSPLTTNSNVMTFTVKSDGNPIDPTYQVLSLRVHRAVNQIPYCEIEIADGNPANEDFPISDSDTFVPGKKIEILAGYENTNTLIFSGIVIKHGIRITSSQGPILMILCKDEAVKMTVGRKNAYFTDTTDSDIMSTLIRKTGLSADVSATNNQLKKVTQYYATDWDFLVSRADMNGLVTIVQDGKVSIKSPSEAESPTLSLTYGIDILEFDAAVDAQEQLKSVQCSTWDMKSQAVTSSQVSPADSGQGNLSTSTLSNVIGLDKFNLQSTVELESGMRSSWAKAKGIKSTYSKIRGRVKFHGSALALPGTLIEFHGLGDRFNGNGYIAGIEHDIRDGNWVTTAEIGISPEWFTAQASVEAPQGAGSLPGIQGLQIGTVKQISNDPDSEFRVQINLPLMQSGDNGVWARLSTFYATKNAGAFFYPEVGDEVIVGFLDNDPSFPIILGSVYSSNHTAPNTPDEQNNLKAFVSREKMKITFDEEKKAITILTPNSNQLILSDEEKSITVMDQHNNFIKLSAEGIQINSASNIKITAAESITMNGPTGLTGTASGGEISLRGMTINCNADTEFSANGTTSASLSASGSVSIKGAMVLINS